MHRMGLFPMIFIAGLLLIDSIAGLDSSINTEVTNFEYSVYGKARSIKSKGCTEFYQGFGHEPDGTFGDPDYLRIDCDRYRRALACYQDIQKSKGADGKPAEEDLSTSFRTKIERVCGL